MSRAKTDKEVLNESLFSAIQSNNESAVIEALKKGANVNAKDSYGNTALRVASWSGGNLKIFNALLKNGANPNVLDGSGEPLAGSLIAEGNIEALKLLAGSPKIDMVSFRKNIDNYKHCNMPGANEILNYINTFSKEEQKERVTELEEGQKAREGTKLEEGQVPNYHNTSQDSNSYNKPSGENQDHNDFGNV